MSTDENVVVPILVVITTAPVVLVDEGITIPWILNPNTSVDVGKYVTLNGSSKVIVFPMTVHWTVGEINWRSDTLQVDGLDCSVIDTSVGKIISILLSSAIRLCAGKNLRVIAVVADTIVFSGVKVTPVSVPVVAVYVIPDVSCDIGN